jgi:hypothetical protein
MQRIETMAQARIPQHMMPDAMNHMHQAKLRIQQEMQAEQRRRLDAITQQTTGKFVRDLTLGIAGNQRGLTSDQVRAVARGEKLVRNKQKLSGAEKDAAMRDRTRWIDPRGHGWTVKEYEARMDALADATPREFSQLAKQYRADPAQLKRAASSWKDERIEYGLIQRRAERTKTQELPEVREPNPDDRRRAAVVTAYLDQTADKMEVGARSGVWTDESREIDGGIHPALLNETHNGELTRRAQIARAFEETESGDE